MSYNAPEHFSHKFELDLNHKPIRSTDRTSLSFVLPGIIFGALLMFIGIYEILNGFRHASTSFDSLIAVGEIAEYQPLINPVFFDIVFILVGLGMIAAAIMSYLRYKKIIFDGKNVTIVTRSSGGEKTIIKENINNYQGVRFRIELIQLGFINKNLYVIELYHKDPSKIIPLFITTHSKNIRRIWEQYAVAFNMPALVNTDEGLVSRDIKNLNKSLKEMAELGYIIDNYDENTDLPDTISFRRGDKIILKARKIIWDAYNIMAWIVILIMGSAVIMAAVNFDSAQEILLNPAFFGFEIAAVLIIIIAIFVLFRKDKLIIKKHKIVHTHKYMLFSTKHDEILKEEIEAIDVTENPVTGRYFVSIISDDKTIAFGRKLPIKDLRWVRKFLIHEVIS